MREYHLARQGYEYERENQLRREANWVAVQLSAQSGEEVTVAELLGEEEESESLADAERRIDETLARYAAQQRAK